MLSNPAAFLLTPLWACLRPNTQQKIASVNLTQVFRIHISRVVVAVLEQMIGPRAEMPLVCPMIVIRRQTLRPGTKPWLEVHQRFVGHAAKIAVALRLFYAPQSRLLCTLERRRDWWSRTEHHAPHRLRSYQMRCESL